MTHKALSHPQKGGCQFKAKLERVETEELCKRASYPLRIDA